MISVDPFGDLVHVLEPQAVRRCPEVGPLQKATADEPVTQAAGFVDEDEAEGCRGRRLYPGAVQEGRVGRGAVRRRQDLAECPDRRRQADPVDVEAVAVGLHLIPAASPPGERITRLVLVGVVRARRRDEEVGEGPAVRIAGQPVESGRCDGGVCQRAHRGNRRLCKRSGSVFGPIAASVRDLLVERVTHNRAGREANPGNQAGSVWRIESDAGRISVGARCQDHVLQGAPQADVALAQQRVVGARRARVVGIDVDPVGADAECPRLAVVRIGREDRGADERLGAAEVRPCVQRVERRPAPFREDTLVVGTVGEP